MQGNPGARGACEAETSSRGKKRKSVLTVKKYFLRPRGRSDVWSLRTDPGAWKATGLPLWLLPPSPCLFFILLCPSVYMVGKWIPKGPFISDRATCKDGFDPLPFQLREEKTCSVQPESGVHCLGSSHLWPRAWGGGTGRGSPAPRSHCPLLLGKDPVGRDSAGPPPGGPCLRHSGLPAEGHPGGTAGPRSGEWAHLLCSGCAGLPHQA